MNTNGRVNLLDNMNNNVFHLYDKIPIGDKTTNYRNALTGNMEHNLLSKTFFSAGNILIIQHGIMAGVYKKSNNQFQIGYQNQDTLKIIMRSIFLQHSKNLSTNITQQVEHLNKLVLDYCIPQYVVKLMDILNLNRMLVCFLFHYLEAYPHIHLIL